MNQFSCPGQLFSFLFSLTLMFANIYLHKLALHYIALNNAEKENLLSSELSTLARNSSEGMNEVQ